VHTRENAAPAADGLRAAQRRKNLAMFIVAPDERSTNGL
jgi:hypothetical protein